MSHLSGITLSQLFIILLLVASTIGIGYCIFKPDREVEITRLKNHLNSLEEEVRSYCKDSSEIHMLLTKISTKRWDFENACNDTHLFSSWIEVFRKDIELLDKELKSVCPPSKSPPLTITPPKLPPVRVAPSSPRNIDMIECKQKTRRIRCQQRQCRIPNNTCHFPFDDNEYREMDLEFHVKFPPDRKHMDYRNNILCYTVCHGRRIQLSDGYLESTGVCTFDNFLQNYTMRKGSFCDTLDIFFKSLTMKDSIDNAIVNSNFKIILQQR